MGGVIFDCQNNIQHSQGSFNIGNVIHGRVFVLLRFHPYQQSLTPIPWRQLREDNDKLRLEMANLLKQMERERLQMQTLQQQEAATTASQKEVCLWRCQTLCCIAVLSHCGLMRFIFLKQRKWTCFFFPE